MRADTACEMATKWSTRSADTRSHSRKLGQHAGQHATRQAAETLLAHVVVVVPDEAGGREAVADVDRARAGEDAVAEGAGVADHQVEAAQVEALEGQGVERHERLVAALDQRQALHETGADVPLAVSGGHRRRLEDRGVDGRVGVQVVENLQHPLGPAVLVEPVVDEGNFHRPAAILAQPLRRLQPERALVAGIALWATNGDERGWPPARA